MARPRSLVEALEVVLGATSPFWLIAGGVLLAIVGGAAYDLVKAGAGENPLAVLGIMLSGLALLVVLAWLVRTYYARLRRALKSFVIEGVPGPPQKRGLICLVSNPVVVQAAVSYHKPELEHLWLAYTRQSEGVFRSLRDEIENDVNGVKVHPVPIDSVYDHTHTEHAVERVFEELPDGFSETDLIADFTGGNKAMTAGMIMACLDAARDLEYVPQEHDSGAGGTPARTGKVAKPVYIHIVSLADDQE